MRSEQLVPADCRLGAAATARSAPSRGAAGAARQASRVGGPKPVVDALAASNTNIEHIIFVDITVLIFNRYYAHICVEIACEC